MTGVLRVRIKDEVCQWFPTLVAINLLKSNSEDTQINQAVAFQKKGQPAFQATVTASLPL